MAFSVQDFTSSMREYACAKGFVVDAFDFVGVPPAETCLACGVGNPAVMCSRCGVRYCGEECQKTHWNAHKVMCLHNPAKWVALLHQNAHLTHALHRYAIDHFYYGTDVMVQEAAKMMNCSWSSFSAQLDKLADTAQKHHDACPQFAALNRSGCILPRWAIAALMAKGAISTDAIPEHLVDFMISIPMLGMCKGRASAPNSIGTIITHLHARPEFTILRTGIKDFAWLSSMDAAMTTPRVYDISLASADYIATEPRSHCDGVSAVEHGLKKIKEGDCTHTFLAVCVNKTAFIVQSFYGHYCATEWCDTGAPLVYSPALDFVTEGRFALEPRPAMRGVMPRTQLMVVLCRALERICGNAAQPADRARAYADLTGIKVPGIDKPMFAQVKCYNMQHI